MFIDERIVELINMPNTYIGEAPIDVDNCQWIRPSAGRSSVYFDKQNYDRPTFSIAVRDKSNRQASQRAHNIYTKIRNWTDAETSLIATRTPRFIGRDDHDRSVYLFNVEIQTGGF